MPTRAELLEEADRRGLLPPEMKAMYDEAKRRGLVGGATDDAPATEAPNKTTALTTRAERLEEAYRRGLMPPDKAARYEEAKRRGIVGGTPPEPVEDEPNKTTALHAGVRGVAQGLTFGLSDEILAGLKAGGAHLINLGQGQSFGERYDESLANERTLNDAAAEEHPIAYYAGDIGSSLVVPGGLARLGIKSAVKAASGQGLKATVKAGAKEGAAYGGAHGAGRSEGGVQERVEGAIGGAAAGAGFGAATPLAVNAVAHVAQPMVNGVRSAVRPGAEAARRVRNAFEADETAAFGRNTADQAERNQTVWRLYNEGRIGGDLRNMDVGGENVRALVRSAANQSPEAREVLQRQINQRYEGQAGRTIEFLRSLIPTNGNSFQAREALRESARRVRAPLYEQAYELGKSGITTPGLRKLASAPVVEAAMKRAADNLRNKVNLHLNPSKRPLQGRKGPTLEYWDQVTRELRDDFTRAQRSGANELAADIANLRSQLQRELDEAVPEFAEARGVARQFFQADDALEAGENFVSGRFGNDAARAAWRGMSAAEQDAFREGFVSRLVQTLDETPDRRSILGRIANSPASRERLEIALGPNRARELEAFLYIEQLQELPRHALGNSTTARQLVELGLAGGTGMLASGGNIADPTTWIVGALTKYGVSRGRQRIDQNMARRIAEMLVSNDEGVFRRGVEQAAHSGSAMTALRSFVADYAANGPTMLPGLLGGSVMAQEDAE